MPTSLSSTFDIVYDGPTLTQNQVCTLSVGPLGRGAFTVEEMSVTGRAATVLTLTRSVTGGTVAVGTVSAATITPAVVTSANSLVPPGENLILTMSGGGPDVIDRFVIRCRPVGTPIAEVIT